MRIFNVVNRQNFVVYFIEIIPRYIISFDYKVQVIRVTTAYGILLNRLKSKRFTFTF